MKSSSRHLYRLIDPTNGETFYIGQTSNPYERLKQHCNPRNPLTSNQLRINKILSSGQYPVMDIFFSVNRPVSVSEFEKIEKSAIKKFLDAGYRLENTSLTKQLE